MNTSQEDSHEAGPDADGYRVHNNGDGEEDSSDDGDGDEDDDEDKVRWKSPQLGNG
ncbi:uncharacterized protein H6S33_011724 [Morchella sextelata]|uniref:uncharacterized protein n=1 Tax=Morchella sextelata TaxID=1174677 RepID=UPI001D04E3B7|nr:uncharacterized protein H6S33_011724 [Morchella sextelata]KAH0610197.1 hypothetical protein H6S33_011724 [Morchella sextelata]